MEKEYFTVSELMEYTGVKAYTVRYWERLNIIRPVRLPSGQRRYTQKDINTILKIKDLIYNQKFTAVGAKKELARLNKEKRENIKAALNDKTSNLNLAKEVEKEIKEILKIIK